MHDLVDYATMESEKTGIAASTWAMTGKLPEPTIDITAGAGLRYALPAKINGGDAVDFTLRPWKEEHDKSIVFLGGGEILRKLKMPHMEPAGMIRVRVGKGRFGHVVDNAISVEVED